MYSKLFGKEWVDYTSSEHASAAASHHDIEFVDFVEEGHLHTGQLYVRGINVGLVEFNEENQIWGTAYAPEGITGGMMEGVSAYTADGLAKKVAKQFHIDL